MRSFSIQRIDHVVLRVRDIEHSLAFYTSVLGCDVKKRRDDLGMIHLSAGSSMIDLVDVNGSIGRQGGEPAGKQRHNVDHFCLRVEPFDEQAILRDLAAAGVAAETAAMRYGAEGTGLSIYLSDPDDNQIELKGPALQP
ncbi:VOC family protein [Pseudomonas sp. SWRI74]|jgi:catechol 2,3-dioxygenase-like lactoylglutathione lyase family enzyme|uniref:VOC family protein n=1 Tax=Pseudomonas azerbaijanoccidentalis TaxID=2842347 RepID=A0ABS6QT33_9PSED|nr:VOC family protein [Pseudomonas azerbaijanoccidentalis]MBV4522068.1 VOC family protein [Pseudomonas azerbaijanoccidentalis]